MYQTLLVDDRAIFILELKRLHVWEEKTGFQIAGEAQNGAMALAMLKKCHYDLVITDIRMPKMDGIELLQEIKRQRLCHCVVLLSEYSDFDYVREGLVYGAFDYLLKPADKRSVSDLLERAAIYLSSLPVDGDEREALGIMAEASQIYPSEEEKNILALIGLENARIPCFFKSASEEILLLHGTDDLLVAALIRRLYLNIVYAFFNHYAWLKLYHDSSGLHQKLISKTGEESLLVCTDTLEKLVAFVGELLPAGAQNMLGEICGYILANPEEDINLSAIANKFFINHTYLSNIFRQKIGLGFNNYVTRIRMARARYLLLHSSMKIYEISGSLGYKDVDYFNRLFKKCNGNTPTDCRKTLREG